MGAVCLLVVGTAPFLGSAETSELVFWRMRVPRVAGGFLAGAMLSLCGMCYQSLFRNALATPYTLGVSGGAALGVAVVVKFHLLAGALWGLGTVAFAGALGAMWLVTALAHLKRGGGGQVLLLAGVAVSFFFSSLILFIQYMGTQGEVFQVMRWMMGSLDLYGYGEVGVLGVMGVLGMVVVFRQVEALNLLAVGDEFAASRGVSLRWTRGMLHGAVSLMVGAVVAVCGPIGFVGMVSPHICRLLTGGNHRRLAPLCMLFGGAFLVICDTLGRLVLQPAELPVGIVTALLGGPFFLWLLLRS